MTGNKTATTRPKIKRGIPGEVDNQGKSYDLINQQKFDREIDVYSIENSYSVYNLIPTNHTLLRDNIQKVPEEYREMNHYDLRKLLKPGPTLNQLRMNFWTEYDACIGEDRKMLMNNIVAGVCSRNTFRAYTRDPEKLAWILTPIQSYQMGVQDILETCLFKMREGLDNLDIEKAKDVALIMKIYEAFDKRLHGDYAQNIKKTVEYKGPVDSGKVAEKMKELGINNNKVVVYEKSGEKE